LAKDYGLNRYWLLKKEFLVGAGVGGSWGAGGELGGSWGQTLNCELYSNTAIG